MSETKLVIVSNTQLAKMIAESEQTLGGYIHRGVIWTGLGGLYNMTIGFDIPAWSEVQCKNCLVTNKLILEAAVVGEEIFVTEDNPNYWGEQIWRKTSPSTWRLVKDYQNSREGSAFDLDWSLEQEEKELAEKRARGEKLRAQNAVFRAADDRFSALAVLKR